MLDMKEQTPGYFLSLLSKQHVIQQEHASGQSCLDQTISDDQIGSEIMMEHTIKLFHNAQVKGNQHLAHVLAKVEWYECHPQRNNSRDSIIVASSVSNQLTQQASS